MSRGQEISSRVLTVPNAISMVRLALVPVFAILIVAHEDALALVVLAVSGITDWLDGVLARSLHQISRLGQVLDPLADRLFIFVTLLGLTWREIVPIWLVAAILARDLVLALTVPVLARLGYGTLNVSQAGKVATFALLYAFPLLLLAESGGAVGTTAHVVGWAFTWWGVGLYWFAGAQYLVQVRRLAVGG
ncbi:CDP-alcohol phosphatidyltransferase family protein [Myceligenerans xiligouense]|uniref:CDP-diacylglycerol-phosphatidylglycerol phosphatidyltransferase n=1 Tax=Myceligenerans xiligouense TaxID=253184 RepID=A0A3N4YQH7_9MICO|nr:CDP-alcohol phosphatidyltransferase family protein [Myceligenerans xiligouense]RPF21594.1 CDP-diacylglycerol-phosphatidylglycerol phosphatidyltransferase [Myceligenerans xiligouense]